MAAYLSRTTQLAPKLPGLYQLEPLDHQLPEPSRRWQSAELPQVQLINNYFTILRFQGACTPTARDPFPNCNLHKKNLFNVSVHVKRLKEHVYRTRAKCIPSFDCTHPESAGSWKYNPRLFLHPPLLLPLSYRLHRVEHEELHNPLPTSAATWEPPYSSHRACKPNILSQSFSIFQRQAA